MRAPRLVSRSWLADHARRLQGDERGAVLVYVTIAIAVILGIVGLALDGARGMITNSEAQGAADAAALAAASQLDGQSGACARAAATATSVVNQQRFAEGGVSAVSLSGDSPRLLSTLPGSDSSSTDPYVLPSTPADCDPKAQYVEVKTQQLTHQNTFLAAVNSTNNTVQIQRTATAGFRRSLCAAAPVMMICSTETWSPGVAFDAWGNEGPNKGFVCPDCNSAPDVENALAQNTPPFCVTDKADPAPGNKTGKAPDGINTRFGEGSTTTKPSDLNVTDFVAYSNELNPTPGSGWNCADYWAANHASDGLAKPTGCSNGTTSVSRYSVYQAEREANKIPERGPVGKTTPAERRLLYLAVINNCPTTAPGTPAYYIKAFILGRAVGTVEKHVYVEPIGVATSKTDPTAIHEEVQLYR